MKRIRWTALLIALVMLVCALPVSSLAATSACRHEWHEVGRKDATCTEEGYINYRCSICRETSTVTLSALGHNWRRVETQDPSCTIDGYILYRCSRCGKESTEKLPALGHDWGEWYVAIEPTVEMEGLMQRKCHRCNMIEEEPIPRLTEEDDGDEEDNTVYALHLSMDAPPIQPYEDLDYSQYFGGPETPVTHYTAHVTNIGTDPYFVTEIHYGHEGKSYELDKSIWLEPGETKDFTVVDVWLEKQIDTSMAMETVYGFMTHSFWAVGQIEAEYVCESNKVEYNFRILNKLGFDDWEVPDDSNAEILKEVIGTSSDPSGYQLGETIFYRMTVTNTGTETINGLKVYETMMGDGDPIAVLDDFLPGESRLIFFNYVVDSVDVANRYVENTAFIEWNGHTVPSNTVTVPTIDKAQLLLTKEVVSTPANGQYYVPGEEIVFTVKIKNNFPTHFKEVAIYDPLVENENDVLTYIEDVGPGEDGTYELRYIVTDYDAYVGYVENVATAWGVDERELMRCFTSNTVWVPAGYDNPPFGVITDLTVWKEEVSTPANGQYYVVGEQIDYKITVRNTGETVIPEGIVYDLLKETAQGEIGAFENLYPETEREYFYSYTVQQSDVPFGKVTNYALVKYWPSENYPTTVKSNSVVSLINGLIPPVTAQPDPDPVIGTGVDCCERTLAVVAQVGELYQQHRCDTHKAIEEQVTALVEAAQNEAALLGAWDEACALWRTELDRLYEEAINAASGERRAALIEDRVAYFAYLETYEALLLGVNPASPYLAKRAVALKLADDCAELCYLLHKAPADRADSLAGTYEHSDETTETTVCATVQTDPTDAGDAQYVMMQCTAHGDTELAVRNLFAVANSRTARLNAGRRAQALWQVQADALTNAAYKAADDEMRKTIAQNRTSFDKLLNARSALLAALYGSREDIPAEVLANHMRDYTAMLCSLWQQPETGSKKARSRG